MRFFTQNIPTEDIKKATENAIEKTLDPLMDNLSWLNTIYHKLADLGWSLLGALITLTIGFWVANRIKKIIEKRMIARNVDLSVRTFLIPVINIVFKLIVIIAVLSSLDVNITGLLGLLSAAAIAVGLALQGSLANLAGGILIILFKPFKIGDYVNTNGNEGTIQSISILYTVILTPRGQVVTIPNSKVYDNAIINYSENDFRRIDISVGVGYEYDIDKVRNILNDVILNSSYVLQDKFKIVDVESFGDNSVNLGVRCNVKSSDFVVAQIQVYTDIKNALDKNNISIPFPQRDVFIKNK